MYMDGMHTNHQLDLHDGLVLRNASGRTVTCLSGSVRLTMEGRAHDIVLEHGASLVVDGDGLTILAAQQTSRVQVSAANQPHNWWNRVVEYLDHTHWPGAVRPGRKWQYYNYK